MAKPITDDMKQKFLAFCQERFADEELNGSFTLSCFEPFEEEVDGDTLWEFDPEDDTHHDIMELFGSVQDHGFAVEIHGHDDFYVVKQ